MITLDLSFNQRSQLVGWCKREKDHLLSVVGMCERCATPGVSGTLSAAREDLTFIHRVWESCDISHKTVDLSQEDCDFLWDIATANTFDNHKEFWDSISQAIKRCDDQSTTLADL